MNKKSKTSITNKIDLNFKLLARGILGTQNSKIYLFSNTVIKKIKNRWYLENFILIDPKYPIKFFSRKPIKFQEWFNYFTIKFNGFERGFDISYLLETINTTRTQKVLGVKNILLSPTSLTKLLYYYPLMEKQLKKLLLTQ